MDIRRTLEKEHSRKIVGKIVDYVGNNPGRFKALVDVFLTGPFRITQRAAWPMTYCVESHPELLRPHFKVILNTLKKPGIHDAVKRNTVRMLQFIDIPKQFEGRIADLCFGYLCNRKEPVAIRVFSMTVLAGIAEKNPELKKELKMIIEDELPYSSAAFKSRGLKLLKQLD